MGNVYCYMHCFVSFQTLITNCNVKNRTNINKKITSLSNKYSLLHDDSRKCFNIKENGCLGKIVSPE